MLLKLWFYRYATGVFTSRKIQTATMGETLEKVKTQNENNRDKATKWVYEGQACPTCLFQEECVKAKSGKRTVTRNEDDPIREAMRTKVQSDEGKAIYRKRKGVVKQAFSEMKVVQGFRQSTSAEKTTSAVSLCCSL